MGASPTYSILFVRGESLKGSPLADQIIALDRKNMEATLRAVGRDFPEDRRRGTLFHPSNQMILATTTAQGLVGYVDYCTDPDDPRDLYLSSIQIEVSDRGGSLFRVLLSNLLINLRSQKFRTIRTHIQNSNPRMMAIAKKVGFTLEENPAKPGTLNVHASREFLDSPKLKRLFG